MKIRNFQSITYYSRQFSIPIGVGNDEESIRVFKSICNISMDQKMILVCIDTSTDKIVGANILWVISKEDNYAQQFADLVNENIYRRDTK